MDEQTDEAGQGMSTGDLTRLSELEQAFTQLGQMINRFFPSQATTGGPNFFFGQGRNFLRDQSMAPGRFEGMPIVESIQIIIEDLKKKERQNDELTARVHRINSCISALDLMDRLMQALSSNDVQKELALYRENT